MSNPLTTFYVRFDDEQIMPYAIPAKNRVDAGVRLMQAKPDHWAGPHRVERLSIEVRETVDGAPVKMDCVDVLKHLRPEPAPTAPVIEQRTLF